MRLRYKTNAIAIMRNRDGQRILSIIAVVIIIAWVALWLVYILRPELNFLPQYLGFVLVNTIPAKIIGVVIICLGLVVYFAAWLTLSNAWRIGQDHNYKGELIQNGIYAISRNPMYLFYDLYFIGIFLINGAVIFLALAVLQIITLHHLIIEEEKSLDSIYGNNYKKYFNRTGRYLTRSKLAILRIP